MHVSREQVLISVLSTTVQALANWRGWVVGELPKSKSTKEEGCWQGGLHQLLAELPSALRTAFGLLAPIAPADTEQLGRSMIGITVQAVHGSPATNLPGKALTYVQILQELSSSIYSISLSIRLLRLVYRGYHMIFTHDTLTQRTLCCCSPILLGWYQRQQKKSPSCPPSSVLQ